MNYGLGRMENNRKLEELTASPNISARRVLGKIFQYLARKMPFLPSKYRVLFQSWHGVQFADRGTVFLGEDVYFDDIYPSQIFVGLNVRITSGVRILTHFFDTRFEPTPDRPFRFYKGKVVIGDNVFIGLNAVIAKPVSIGEGAVIGANSLVISDVPPNAIYVGVPAVGVGERPPMKGNAV